MSGDKSQSSSRESSFEYVVEEMDKCKNNPYYFFTTYFIVNGKKATTILSEKEFNKIFNNTQQK